MVLFRLIGLIIDLLFLPLRLVRRGRIVRPNTWLSVVLDGPIVDMLGKPRFWQLRKQKALSLHFLDELVTAALRDARVKGLIVTIKSMAGGMASSTALRNLLLRARAGGKEVVVHLPHGGDTKEVYVASAASKVLIGPATQLSPLGFRSSTRYLRRALDQAGIEPQVFACGEFKSAGETLMRDSMSDEQRLQLDRLFDSFHTVLIDAIAEGRGIGAERARAIVDGAPYFGTEAVAAGLADDIAYEDEVKTKLGTKHDAVDAREYLARAQRPLLRPVRRRPIVRVIPIHGAIAHATGIFGGLSLQERVVRSVRSARRERRVRGVVLHIDSPGGSALASDIMHHEIVQLAREKPVVVYMANVAASGGYYVAAPAECIVAQPTTVTGSIGVVAMRLSLEPLLDRLGVRTEVIEKGAHANLLSPVGPLSDDDRATIMRELDATYRSFIDVVATGREMPRDEVEKLARGRVYTGKDALEVGLVDVLGGFDTALEEVKRRLPANIAHRVLVDVARPPRDQVSVLDPPEKRALERLLGAILGPRERMVLDLHLSRDRVWALSPITET